MLTVGKARNSCLWSFIKCFRVIVTVTAELNAVGPQTLWSGCSTCFLPETPGEIFSSHEEAHQDTTSGVEPEKLTGLKILRFLSEVLKLKRRHLVVFFPPMNSDLVSRCSSAVEGRWSVEPVAETLWRRRSSSLVKV